MLDSLIVKRRGTRQQFDERKVYSACYHACLTAQLPVASAEKISALVSARIRVWVVSKTALSSDEIFERVSCELEKHDQQAAFMYRTHRDIA